MRFLKESAFFFPCYCWPLNHNLSYKSQRTKLFEIARASHAGAVFKKHGTSSHAVALSEVLIDREMKVVYTFRYKP